MLQSEAARDISARIRDGYHPIRNAIYSAFQKAIIGSDKEREFLDKIGSALDHHLTNINPSGLSFKVQTANIDRKPIVETEDYKRELGDLVVTVKYLLPDGFTEKKSIVYQVKMADRGTQRCRIDQQQLDLLCNWPEFRFGKKAVGYFQYNPRPTTLEFGSFMLEPRNPSPSNAIRRVQPSYGIAPPAPLIDQRSGKSVKLGAPIYCRGDAQNMFSHIAFEIGEHHSTLQIDRLIASVYRYVGLNSDPPNEFVEFMGEPENGGFHVIEITVGPGEAS